MKSNPKMRMVRPSEALLPAAYLVAVQLDRSNAALKIYLCQWISLMLGLAAARGLRQAFSEQPSLRRVRGSVMMALMLHGGSAVLLLPILWLCRHTAVAIPVSYSLAGVLLNIEHVFYEYLYATGDGASADGCHLITAILMLGGMRMTSRVGHANVLASGILWPMVAAALSAIVAAVIAWQVGDFLRGRLNDQVVKCAPSALLQSAVYPAASLILSRIPGLSVFQPAAPFFAGLIVYDLCRSPFRRGASESTVMNRVLLILFSASLFIAIACCIAPVRAALTSLAGGCVDMIRSASFMAAAGCVCGFAMFGSIRTGSE